VLSEVLRPPVLLSIGETATRRAERGGDRVGISVRGVGPQLSLSVRPIAVHATGLRLRQIIATGRVFHGGSGQARDGECRRSASAPEARAPSPPRRGGDDILLPQQVRGERGRQWTASDLVASGFFFCGANQRRPRPVPVFDKCKKVGWSVTAITLILFSDILVNHGRQLWLKRASGERCKGVSNAPGKQWRRQ
jgi:hypothetical protein